MSDNVFEYAILKSEQTSEIVFIIHIFSSWLEQEIDLSYENNTFNIILNQVKFTSTILPKIAQDWLKHNPAKIYFANEDGQIISETVFELEYKEIYGTEN